MEKIKYKPKSKQQASDNESIQTKIIKKKFKFLCSINPIIMGSFGEIGSYIKLETMRTQGNDMKQVSSYKHAL